MPDSTPVHAFPFPLPSDAVVDYPALGRDLAEMIETVLTGDLSGLQTVTTEHGMMLDRVNESDCLYFGSDFQTWLRRNYSDQSIECATDFSARVNTQYGAHIGLALGSAAGMQLGQAGDDASFYKGGPSQITFWSGGHNTFVTLYAVFQSPASAFERAEALPASCLVELPEPPPRAEDAGDDLPPLAPAGPAVDLAKLCDWLVGRVAELEARLETLEAREV